MINIKTKKLFVFRGKHDKDMIPIVSKRGHYSKQKIVGTLPNTEIKVYEQRESSGVVNPNVVGFTLSHARMSHPRWYLCHATSIFHNKTDDIYSDRTKLVVLKVNQD